MNDDDIKLPERPDPDGYITIKIIGRDVEVNAYRDSTMEAYARAAILADRASRDPSPQGDARPTGATLRCRRCGDTADVSFSYASAAQPSCDVRMSPEMRSYIEGMSVSVDVSTGDHDAGHRYFGTVTEVMDCKGDKHGVTLLVQDAKPNFSQAPQAEPSDEDVLLDALPNLEHDNYERSYNGSKNREADAGLIRAALECYGQALAALKAESEMLREALKDADNEMDQLDEDMGECDHSVGVCVCSYWSTRRKMKAALAREVKHEN